jgi:hypothetical protein
MEHRWNEIDRGKPKYSKENLRGEKPATNRLSHGTAFM